MIEKEKKKSEAPLVTFALFAYNQERYIREAIEGAFSQDYGNLEIILSDDCSSDNTFSIIQEMAENYSGPHRIVINRNSRNLNVAGHFNVVAEMSKGELLIASAGDDISFPERSKAITEEWQRNGKCSIAIYSDFIPVDSESNVVSDFAENVFRGTITLEDAAKGGLHVLGATAAYSMDLFTSFPKINSDVRHEDRVLPFRALLMSGACCLVDEKLVQYRVEGGVSRGKPNDGRDYVFEYTQSRLARVIPDARQRLCDLYHKEKKGANSIALAANFLLEQETILDLSRAEGLAVELVFIKAFLKLGFNKAILSFYIKRRFVFVYNLYYGFRFSH
jgi:glycosyltransferase involved in cell wall biosynthesis